MISDMETRLKQELGPQLYDDYATRISNRSPTDFCDACIANQRKRNNGKFYPDCTRSTNEIADKKFGHLDARTRLLATMAIDPVVWAEQMFGWKSRWYQSQSSRCTATWKVHRWGRRGGKTAFLALRALHASATKPRVGLEDPFTTLVVAPYEPQLKKIFQYMRDMLSKSDTFKPSRDVNDPMTLEFPNKSTIIGFTAGEKSGSRSDNIRGQDANLIIIDEADRLRSDDIDAIIAILASHSECLIEFATTPTGLPTRFKSACESPERGFKEFWFTSYESPEYTDKADVLFKKSMPRETYEHEILAIFGASEGGVFMPAHLEPAIKDYPLGQQPLPNEYTLIGVDSNDPDNGTHAVVIAVNNQKELVRVIDKSILRGEAFSKAKSERMLLDLYAKWNPLILAFDKGYAHGQIEDLAEYGMLHPETDLSNRLRSYDLGANHIFRDPTNGMEIPRPYKPLMVGISQRFLMEGKLTLPKVEDVESGIVGQMRQFHVKRKGQDGRPIYSQGKEHTLTGMMIALMAWQIEILGFDLVIPSGSTIRAIQAPIPVELRLTPDMRTIEPSNSGHVFPPGFDRAPRRVMWDDEHTRAPRSSPGQVRRKHF